MKNFKLLAVTVVVMSMVCGVGVVYAGEEQSKDKPCAADVQKFCKDIKPGEGRVIACLKSHQADLSKACSAMLANNPKPKVKPSKGND
jgi:hypothetical protein